MSIVQLGSGHLSGVISDSCAVGQALRPLDGEKQNLVRSTTSRLGRDIPWTVKLDMIRGDDMSTTQIVEQQRNWDSKFRILWDVYLDRDSGP